jgi:starch-binding outer membrane protein, SusD/RagB family
MKEYILKFTAIFAVLLFSTCNEEVLDVENRNALTIENWYQTEKDFELALNSCHCPLMGRGMFGLQFTYMFETFSDRVLYEKTGKDRLSFNSTDEGVDNVWRDLYFGLFRTTKLILNLNKKGVEGIKNMDEAKYDFYMSQARSLRSVFYFYLVVLFNKPIFYNEDNIPVDDYLKNLSNGAPEHFWNQIETDINLALPKLPLKSELAESEMGRVTKGAAKALLAKSLLYKHYYYYCKNGYKGSAEDMADLNKAKQLFEEIINSNEYSLVQVQNPKTKEDYLFALLSNSAFIDLVTSEGNTYKSENNMESVWEIQFTDGQAKEDNWWLPGWMSPGEMGVQYFSPHQESYKNHEVHPALYRAFETEGVPDGFDRDPRCDATLYFKGDLMDFREDSPYKKSFNPLTSIKRIAFARGLELPEIAPHGIAFQKHFFPIFYQGIYAPGNSPTNKRMIRYADVLLMYAEVEFLLGNSTGPGLDALNQVRQRVDMPVISELTTESIMHERDVELAYEWSRWFDLIRWSFDPAWGINWDEVEWGIDDINSVNPFVIGKYEFLPIPLNEIDLHEGALVQNPGW